MASVNALNQRSRTVYNAANQAVASINATGIRSTQVYDDARRGIASVNPKGKRWTTIYNSVRQTVGGKDLRRAGDVNPVMCPGRCGKSGH